MKQGGPTNDKATPRRGRRPELLSKRGHKGNATPLDQAIGDLTLIALYYLLRIGEYTVKGKAMRPNKQCNLNTRISLSSKRSPRGNYDASHALHLHNLSQLRTGQR